jgi:hypothetical protein
MELSTLTIAIQRWLEEEAMKRSESIHNPITQVSQPVWMHF